MTGCTEIRVRYTECDPMGVAHHTAYPVWFEIGRTELLRENGVAYRDLEQQGFLIAVVKLSVQYKQPARYDDLLVLQTCVTQIRRATINHSYDLRRDGCLLTTACTTVVCLDRDGRPQPLPPQLSRDCQP